MQGTTIIIIVLAVLSVLLIGGAIAKAATSDVKLEESEPIRSFSGYVGSNLETFDGGPQITCPSGSTVNIIGAWFEVYDPFVQCYPDGPTNDLINACADPNPTYEAICTTNVNAQKQNPVCLPPSSVPTPAQASLAAVNQPMCVRRDASAYLAEVCNGKSSCPVAITAANFGPLPCAVFNSGQLNALPPSQYAMLPDVPANPGFTPTGKGTPVPATTRQGYYVHGIYVCVPSGY